MRKALRLAAVLALAGAACQVVAGIERVEKAPLTADGGVDTGAIPAGDPCNHAAPPLPPDEDDDREGIVPPFYLAVRTLSLTTRTVDTVPSGLDLDNVCTCETRPGTAKAGASSCTAKQSSCDYDGGVDNRGATLFKQFEVAGSASIDEGATNDITEGKQGLLIQISDWNGKPNDREVSVGAIISPGITDPTGCGNLETSEDGFYHPGWCGSDRWNYPKGLVFPAKGELYPIVRGAAYIVNNTLVFRSETPIQIFFENATLTFGSPITVGKLLKEDGIWKMKGGLLTGRMPIDQLLGAVGQLGVRPASRSDAGKEPLCATPLFPGVKTLLCDAVDISRSNVYDFKEGACDAVSSAIAFEAEEAKLGIEVTSAPSNNECSPNRPENKAKYTCP